MNKLVIFKHFHLSHEVTKDTTRIIYYTPKQTELPEDLWLSILEYLGVKALTAFGKTCTDNRDFVKWMYPNLLMGPKISNKCCTVL